MEKIHLSPIYLHLPHLRCQTVKPWQSQRNDGLAPVVSAQGTIPVQMAHWALLEGLCLILASVSFPPSNSRIAAASWSRCVLLPSHFHFTSNGDDAAAGATCLLLFNEA